VSAYVCTVCGNVIPSVTTHIVNENAAIICLRCAEDPATHAVLYPACPVSLHSALDHPCAVGTALGAHREMLRIWAAREVAAG
jgi:hypothetical protein